MPTLGLETKIVDEGVYARTVRRFREGGVVLPTFSELADPGRIPERVSHAAASVDVDAPHPLNLFRVHWYNGEHGRRVDVPEYLDLPSALTGVDARILVALGDRFPMIQAHKVLAAYGCLVPRLVTGQFDPLAHRAVWPSTGNYCRGGVAISRILGCRGVAVLPEGMSDERFAWLARWVATGDDVIKTPGSESNVKEIYDRCAELDRDPANIIFNQFCEFGNYIAHVTCTGPALERVWRDAASRRPDLALRAFVSASGSAGTLAAGDYLKAAHGTAIVAAEALECPTMLYNGFGAHNIQGIGDKHIPLIHNVMNTDIVTAISDRSTDALGVLFGTRAGREYLAARRGVPEEITAGLDRVGLSGICNILAAIKTARRLRLGAGDAIVTVATDGASMYRSERDKTLARAFGGRFDEVTAAEVFGAHLLGADGDHFLELTHRDRERIFNLGYFTWVEQQGLSLDEFERRRAPDFWRALPALAADAWDPMIAAFNRETGAASHAGG
ncbi:MAG: pyridoxal-5'-phosphate-dependent protein subunit beta [bacterium]